ncbi:hypothetical protein RRG08_013350 [Elysia crispata]|uniref:Uncharacterized protein n=1 Tax=Elysia crispata TaxID=231223 RepID=A0AAE1AYK6_9GAST|nr:hypothetical protein RRG08_013350 [Elysia crispata]
MENSSGRLTAQLQLISTKALNDKLGGLYPIRDQTHWTPFLVTSYTSGSRSDRHGRTSPKIIMFLEAALNISIPQICLRSLIKKKPVSDNLPHRRTNVASHFSIEMRRAGPDLVNFVQQRARESTAWFRGVGAHSPTIQFGFSLSYMFTPIWSWEENLPKSQWIVVGDCGSEFLNSLHPLRPFPLKVKIFQNSLTKYHVTSIFSLNLIRRYAEEKRSKTERETIVLEDNFHLGSACFDRKDRLIGPSARLKFLLARGLVLSIL